MGERVVQHFNCSLAHGAGKFEFDIGFGFHHPIARALAKLFRDEAKIADGVIRNTYRVLMTRGLKGCYVFCTDRKLAGYLRAQVPQGVALAYPTPKAELPIAAEEPLEG